MFEPLISIKRFSTAILLVAIAFCCFHVSYAAETDKTPQPIGAIQIPTTKESGLMLDIARHFYPLEVIKAFIDTLHDSGATFFTFAFFRS